MRLPKILLAGAALAIIVLLIIYIKPATANQYFADDFHTVQHDSMTHKGWFVQSKDAVWWQRRTELSNHLTLFTLQGDNWADSAHSPVIKNLMLRKINGDCFIAEVHLDNFIPTRKWQQAGILLMEDTGFFAKSVRLSIAYNDFFGGYNRPGEIIIQAISSGSNEASNPEEILHLPLFNLGPGQDALISSNLQKSALRIEKTGSHFRFLYAAGSVNNFAFKEALSKDIFIQPKYVGLFALQGFVNDTNYIPAHFKFFSIKEESCK